MPLYPDSGPPRLDDFDSGLYAPSHSDARHSPALFTQSGTPSDSRTLRAGRPASAHPVPSLQEVVQAMSSWESYGMRLLVN